MSSYIVYLIVGVRKCSYEDEYAPEVLGAIDKYSNENNTNYLESEIEKYRKDESFDSVKIIEVELDGNKIDDIVYERFNKVEGKIKDNNNEKI